MFLQDRFLQQGTLSDPKGVPDPTYALPGTLNWMRALAILVDASTITPDSVKAACAAANVTKGANLTDQAKNTIFEQLLMSLHHLSALQAMASLPAKIDTSRSGIVTWYYGIFHAASAMIAAQDGSYQDNHAETANSWDRQFKDKPFIPRPFGYRVTTLVKKDMEAEIEALRAGNVHNLNSAPTNQHQAFGACMSYLKGTSDWRREYIEDDLRNRELKKMGLDNFRSKPAKELRDARLHGKTLGFVHQAFRYRGKANYREALFISYGQHIEALLHNYPGDLVTVLKGFLCLAGTFSSIRIGKPLWNEFLDDLEGNTSLVAKPKSIWKNL